MASCSLQFGRELWDFRPITKPNITRKADVLDEEWHRVHVRGMLRQNTASIVVTVVVLTVVGSSSYSWYSAIVVAVQKYPRVILVEGSVCNVHLTVTTMTDLLFRSSRTLSTTKKTYTRKLNR
jgi:hypothetical protein